MSRPRPGRAAAAVVSAGLAAATVGACAPAAPAPGRTSAVSPAAATSTSAGPSTPAAPTSAARPTSHAATATGTVVAGASNSAVADGGAITPRSTCTSIGIRVIRGSAAPGYEFAALQFTNTGTSRCVLNGYPAVTLRRSGADIGSAARPAGTTTSTITLDPGDTAESRLRDYSDCSAALSDEIVVTAPGSSVRGSRPAQLRGCTLRVYPLALPD